MLYARISEDISGEMSGVRRQMEACRELAKARGWRVVAEHTDNDISALKGAHRPGYRKIVALVEADEVDFVVVWQTSRLLRNRRERADAIDLFGRMRVGIISVKGQDLDLSNAYGRGMAGMLGEFDTMESEVKSERVAAAAKDRARRGLPNGVLGYGWRRAESGGSTYEVDPVEADVVRRIVADLNAGRSLLAVTRQLNDREEPSPEWSAWQRLTGDDQRSRLARGRKPPTKQWGKTSVKKVVLRPANVALRVHHRGRPTQALFEGNWPPLVEKSDWELACSRLTAADRRTNGAAKPGARKHLLSWGIGRCGVCGSHLRVSRKGNARWGTKKLLYVCDVKGCVGRDEQSVDALVLEVVVGRLSQPDALDWMRGDDKEERRLAAEIDAVRRRLNNAADQYADGAIDAPMLKRISARLRPQLEALEAQDDSTSRRLDDSLFQDLAGSTARQRWIDMEVAQRRAVLVALGLTVVVDRVTKRGPGFEPESIRFDWARAS